MKLLGVVLRYLAALCGRITVWFTIMWTRSLCSMISPWCQLQWRELRPTWTKHRGATQWLLCWSWNFVYMSSCRDHHNHHYLDPRIQMLDRKDAHHIHNPDGQPTAETGSTHLATTWAGLILRAIKGRDLSFCSSILMHKRCVVHVCYCPKSS